MFPKHPFFLRCHVKFQCPQGFRSILKVITKKQSLHFHPSSLFPPAISVLSGSGSTKSKSGRDKAINGFTLWAVETTQFMCLKGECTYFTTIISNIYGILCDLIVIGNLHDFKRMIRIPTFNIQHEAMWSSYHRYFDVETLLRTSEKYLSRFRPLCCFSSPLLPKNKNTKKTRTNNPTKRWTIYK